VWWGRGEENRRPQVLVAKFGLKAALETRYRTSGIHVNHPPINGKRCAYNNRAAVSASSQLLQRVMPVVEGIVMFTNAAGTS